MDTSLNFEIHQGETSLSALEIDATTLKKRSSTTKDVAGFDDSV